MWYVVCVAAATLTLTIHVHYLYEDCKIWEVAFGLENDLLEAGAGSPADFVRHREECVIMMSDQVPFFCMAKAGKQLYKADEFRKAGSRSSASAEVRGGHNDASVVRDWAELEADDDGMRQSRGAEHKGADKFRITVELVHEVHHWFRRGEGGAQRLLGQVLGCHVW